MGARFPAPVQTGPGAHRASCTMGYRVFPGVKSDRSVTLTPHPLQVPWSRKSRDIPLLPLWTVRPVQSLSACTTVHFTFTFTFVYLIFSQCYTVKPERTNIETEVRHLRELLQNQKSCNHTLAFLVTVQLFNLFHPLKIS